MGAHTPSPEVVASLEDLMGYEYLIQRGNFLPSHPVYSILAGRHASKLRGRGLDFDEVRLYVPGDDIRNIDWKVTARTGSTHSKVFNEEKERPTFLVIDQTSAMFFGSQRFTKSVIAAQSAALGAFYTIRRGDRVGGLVFSDEDYEIVTPKRSKALVQYLLQLVSRANEKLLHRIKANINTSRLNEMLDRTLRTVTHDYVITVVTDLLNHDTDTIKLLQRLSYHNDVICIHIADPLDEMFPDGKIVLTDAQRQIQWQNDRRNWGKKYEQSSETFKATLTDELRRQGIPLVFFSTLEPVEQQVRRNMQHISSR